MKEFRVLRYIHPDIRLNERIVRILEENERRREGYRRMLKGEKVSWWLVNLLALIEDLDLARARQLAKRFKFKRKNFDKIIASKEIEKYLIHELSGRNRMLKSTIYKRLTGLPLEVLLLILSKSKNPRLKKRVILYLTTLRKVRIKITGEDLKGLGLLPGPQFKKVLNKIFEARLDGRVKNKKEEWIMAKRLITELGRK
jgi:tRNA nucleotidyltransferase (CCA-adding enzyme)